MINININVICILSIYFINSSCEASSDIEIPMSANEIHFSSPLLNFNIIFNTNNNIVTNFSSVTIKHKDSVIEIPASELNIIQFSKMDEVKLYRIGDSDVMYIMIIDYFGDKRERHEDRLFFDSKKYLKRVTLKIDANDKADYVTKINSEAEKPGIN